MSAHLTQVSFLHLWPIFLQLPSFEYRFCESFHDISISKFKPFSLPLSPATATKIKEGNQNQHQNMRLIWSYSTQSINSESVCDNGLTYRNGFQSQLISEVDLIIQIPLPLPPAVAPHHRYCRQFVSVIAGNCWQLPINSLSSNKNKTQWNETKQKEQKTKTKQKKQ